MRKSMQKNTSMGVALLTVGAGSALTAASIKGEGPEALAVAAGLLAGACTALGVTSVLIGWTGRRPAEDAER